MSYKVREAQLYNHKRAIFLLQQDTVRVEIYHVWKMWSHKLGLQASSRPPAHPRDTDIDVVTPNLKAGHLRQTSKPQRTRSSQSNKANECLT